jgi:hypothetical protein
MRASDTTSRKGESADGEADSFSERVDARVTEDTRKRVERVAYELSEPGNSQSSSEIVRDALHEYLDKMERELALVEDEE